MDLEERLSYVHSASVAAKDQDYDEVKTPTDLEGGAALAEGGALPLFSLEAIGLYSQYFAIGVLYAMMPGLTIPIYQNYLRLESFQVTSYKQLITLGWSFKVVFGMLSDCFPIMGYRRKSWMLIGWTCSAVCLIVMATSSMGDAYCNPDETKFCKTEWAKVPEKDKHWFNTAAPDQGTKFIVLSMILSLSYIISACSSDAMVVEYAQREPEAIRGRIQTAIYTVRYAAGILSYTVTGFGLNGKRYGGSFSFSMAPNVPYYICLIPVALVMVTTVFLVVDRKCPGTPLREWCATFWGLLQKRAMWQICAFRFINNLFHGIESTATVPMSVNWAGVEPLNDALNNIFTNVIMSAMLTIVGKFGLGWNWRYAIAGGTIGIVLIDSVFSFITIWDVFRNQWFYMGASLSENIPSGVRFIVGTYCAVELAEPGTEGATYGLVTTMNNVTGPIASVIYKYMDSFFMVKQDDLLRDNWDVRMDVSKTYFIMYASKLFALVWLVLLPPQKADLQALKRKGGSSKWAGIILIFLYVCGLSFATTTNIMSIYPSTKCYRIVGGNGIYGPDGKCPKPKPTK